MKDLYNPDELRVYLQYVDADNLYEWAMINKLPTHGFKWKNEENVTLEKTDEHVKKDKRGYLLEFDVEYPKELHENHMSCYF